MEVIPQRGKFLKIFLIYFYLQLSSGDVNILQNGIENLSPIINSPLIHKPINSNMIFGFPMLPPGQCWNKQLPNLPIPTGALFFKDEVYIKECCKGYQISLQAPNECIPFCFKPCTNGICTAPNTCTCSTLAVKSLSNDCVLACPLSCLNGQCHNDQCMCNFGYELDEITKKFCKPICTKEKAPLNANCTAPYTFDCPKGYQWNNKEIQGCERAKCAPICGPGGRCLAENQCDCDFLRGFTLINGSCQSTCANGCTNGRCINKDVCKCDAGWKLNINKTGCESIPCETRCLHGRCSPTTNACECNDGYKLSINSQRCIPQCDGGCPLLSRCTAPNHCRCISGYYRSYGRCKRRRHRDPSIFDILNESSHSNQRDKPIQYHNNYPINNNPNYPHSNVNYPRQEMPYHNPYIGQNHIDNNPHGNVNYPRQEIPHHSQHKGQNHIDNNPHSNVNYPSQEISHHSPHAGQNHMDNFHKIPHDNPNNMNHIASGINPEGSHIHKIQHTTKKTTTHKPTTKRSTTRKVTTRRTTARRTTKRRRH